MIKDVSDSDILASGKKQIKKHIESINEILVTDELTKVYNRKFLKERLPADLDRSYSEGRPFAVVMADLDHFKNVNDTYGHLAGDAVLIQLAALFSSMVRGEVDWVSRFGGEEFLIGLYNAGGEVALKVAEKLRKAVEETEFTFNGSIIMLTCSFGVCSSAQKPGQANAEEMILCADANLYEAKRTGRNKCVLSGAAG
jgi:diguanylate cyclase (GGDEF)-like protein